MGIFTNTTNLNRHIQENSINRSVNQDYINSLEDGWSGDSWKNDPLGTGLKNTQQLKIDWGSFENHVFFNSAEAKVNLAFDQIINGYPFDGDSSEKLQFLSNIPGYTNHVLGRFDSHLGYLNFSENLNGANQHVEIEDDSGRIAPELARTVGKSYATKNMHVNGSTIEFWIYIDDSLALQNGEYSVIYQKSAPGDNSNESRKGFSVIQQGFSQNPDTGINETTLRFLIGSDDFKSISLAANIEHDKWNHVAFVYQRGTSERVISYVNSKLYSQTSATQAELDDILTANGKIRIGWSDIKHVGFADATMATDTLVYFSGLIDEIRVWNVVRPLEQIKRFSISNVNAHENLLVYYRFNEPDSGPGLQYLSLIHI